MKNNICFDDHPNALPDGFGIFPSSMHGRGLYVDGGIKVNHRSHYIIDGVWKRGVIGAYLNHSDTPNCILEERGSEVYVVSTETFNDLTELTVNYRLYPCGEGIKDKIEVINQNEAATALATGIGSASDMMDFLMNAFKNCPYSNIKIDNITFSDLNQDDDIVIEIDNMNIENS